MRWLLLAIILAGSLGDDAPARAAAGLDLVWTRCAPEGGVGDIALDCDNSAATAILYGTFESPQDIAHLDFVDFVVDLQTDSSALPPFWNIVGTIGGSEDGCGGVNLDDEASGQSTCPSLENLWRLAPGSGRIPLLWEYIARFGGPNRGRFLFSLPCRTCRWMPDPSSDVIAGTHYFGFRLDVLMFLADRCSGCTIPTVIVFNQVTLHPTTGSPIALTGPGLVSNCATTFGGGSTPCGATPVRNRTWGAIKSLYR